MTVKVCMLGINQLFGYGPLTLAGATCMTTDAVLSDKMFTFDGTSHTISGLHYGNIGRYG